MSHFVNDKKDLKKLSEYLKYIQIKLIDKDMISEMLEYLLPKSESGLLVDYTIKEVNNSKYKTDPAYYFPLLNTIFINLDEIVEWIEINYDIFLKHYDIDENTFRGYLLLYLLVHELEHAYQGLIRLNTIKAPYKIVKEGYSTFMNLLVNSNKSKISPIKNMVRDIRITNYYKKKDYYVLERNANLEASMTMLSLALHNEDKKATKVFTDSTKAYSVIGYENSLDGCMLQTFKELYYYSKYKKVDKSDINDDDRIRFGLEISPDKRKELIKTCSSSYNYFFK